MLLNAHHEPIHFSLPEDGAGRWLLELDSAALEKPAAEARRAANLMQNSPEITEGGESLTSENQGKTRDRIAGALGVGVQRLQRAVEVSNAAEAEPERYGDLPAKMDTESVNAAHKELKARKSTAAPDGYTGEGVPFDVKLEPAHPFAEIMDAVTKLSGAITRAMGGESEEAKRLREYLSWCGAVLHTAGKFENGEHIDASAAFLPLKGIRKIIDLAGASGKPKTQAEIKHAWEIASGGEFVHPALRRIRSRKAVSK